MKKSLWGRVGLGGAAWACVGVTGRFNAETLWTQLQMVAIPAMP